MCYYFYFLLYMQIKLIDCLYSKCTIFINSKPLAEASNCNQKMAKKEAAIIGLEELKKYYYTIKVCIAEF